MQDINTNKISAESEHKVIISNRDNLTVTGVINVETFLDNEIVLVTNYGKMTLKGKDFSITNVNVETGDFAMVGKIDSVIYSKKMYSEDEKLMKRLFK